VAEINAVDGAPSTAEWIYVHHAADRNLRRKHMEPSATEALDRDPVTDFRLAALREEPLHHWSAA